MKIKKILQITFLLTLFSLILNQTEIKVDDNLDKKETIENQNKTPKKFDFKVTVETQYKYLIFRTYVKNKAYTSPMHIFFHHNQIPDESNYEKASVLYHENILALK